MISGVPYRRPLTSSDVSPVEFPHDPSPSLDVNVLAVELNLILSFILGVVTVLVVGI